MRKINKNILYDLIIITLMLISSTIIFWNYVTGKSSPPWDFYGDYYTQAYSWWDLGNFFEPTPFLPYLISGYPAHLGLQVSSYYLPVGIIAEFFDYTIRAATLLQFFTIIFGIIGIYFLFKELKFNREISFFASLAYLFSAGFFSNASHIDIVRAWSFFPWLLYFLIPRKTYTFKFKIITVLIWFQFFVGSYPGNIASYAYLFLIWIIFQYLRLKPNLKNQLKFYCYSVGFGAILSLPKYLPFILDGTGPNIQNQIVVNSGIISTIFFPYGGTGVSGDIILPNDLTQRTFFIIPLVFLSIFLIKKLNLNFFTGLIIFVFSIVLGIDFGIYPHWQENLPLLDISRFRTIDFKPGITFGLILMSCTALSQKNKVIEGILKLIITLPISILIYIFAKNANLKSEDLNFGLKIIAVSYLILIIYLFLDKSFFGVFALTIVLFIIGYQWANFFPNPWKTDRISTEKIYFGNTVSNLIAVKDKSSLVTRPARVGPEFPIPYPGEMIIQFWNGNELQRKFTTGGYVTIKGEEKYQQYVEFALDKNKKPIMEFLAANSQLKSFQSGIESDENCLLDTKCKITQIDYKFLSWKPGRIEVKINSVSSPSVIFLNEVFWDGWQIEKCNFDNCKTERLSNRNNDLLLSAEIDKSTTQITFIYKTPGLIMSFALFYSVILFILIEILVKIKIKSQIKI